MKQIISILLTITMIFCITTSIPLSVSAATTDKVESNYTYTDQYGSWTYQWTNSCDGYKITGYDKSMNDIEIPNAIDNIPVLEIGDSVFYYCNSLTSITIPNGVTTIEQYAFYNCSSLIRIIVPDSVTTIEQYAFYGCRSLNDIYYTGSESQWNNISKKDIGNYYLTNATIHFNFIKYKTGDLSGDDIISIKDVLYLMKYLIGDMELTYSQFISADVNNDGEITLADAVMLQKVVLGIIEFV
ncbi:MAG: leucine-rich repeat protein [Acutalibacteraceae bacterium]|nr:leucine-rich repeat protein [Acutalibacteraceae bacterium]